MENYVQITVLGIGNTLRADDGAGVHALARLESDPRLPAGVRLVEGGTLGMDLIGYTEGCSHLLILDAVDANELAGTLMRFRNETLDLLPVGRSVHLLGLADMLGAMRLLGCAPQDTVLIGVQPESTDWSTSLTPLVEAAMSQMVDEAIKQIEVWLADVETSCAATSLAQA